MISAVYISFYPNHSLSHVLCMVDCLIFCGGEEIEASLHSELYLVLAINNIKNDNIIRSCVLVSFLHVFKIEILCSL